MNYITVNEEATWVNTGVPQKWGRCGVWNGTVLGEWNWCEVVEQVWESETGERK